MPMATGSTGAEKAYAWGSFLMDRTRLRKNFCWACERGREVDEEFEGWPLEDGAAGWGGGGKAPYA